MERGYQYGGDQYKHSMRYTNRVLSWMLGNAIMVDGGHVQCGEGRQCMCY